MFFIALFTVIMVGQAIAQTPILFVQPGGDDRPLGHGPAKSPIATPLVYLENHTLTFLTTHPEYILHIKDE